MFKQLACLLAIQRRAEQPTTKPHDVNSPGSDILTLKKNCWKLNPCLNQIWNQFWFKIGTRFEFVLEPKWGPENGPEIGATKKKLLCKWVPENGTIFGTTFGPFYFSPRPKRPQKGLQEATPRTGPKRHWMRQNKVRQSKTKSDTNRRDTTLTGKATTEKTRTEKTR